MRKKEQVKNDLDIINYFDVDAIINAKEQLKEIRDKEPESIQIYTYALGYIHGKRAARKRINKKQL